MAYLPKNSMTLSRMQMPLITEDSGIDRLTRRTAWLSTENVAGSAKRSQVAAWEMRTR